MILSDLGILEAMKQGDVVISPFSKQALGSNSYDVHLGADLAIYDDTCLDAKRPNQVTYFKIPPEGLILEPDELYLGVTKEYTETHRYVPFLEGKSSIGRLGIDIHATAGKGDIGFCNHWTLEISVKKPVRVYEGMPIGQLIFFAVQGEVGTAYGRKQNAKYTTVSTLPMPSKMWQNFEHHEII